MLSMNGALPLCALLAIGPAAVSVRAQINHPCAPVVNSEFKLTTVVARSAGISEPIKMALDMDAQGNVDIYFVERLGLVKKYSGATKTVATLATIPIYIGYEDGLTGIALDPDFRNNRRMFLYWGQGTDKAFTFRVSRFTLDPQGKLDMASEKIVLDIPATATRMHTGGALAFDAGGDLWITTGENQSGEEGPSNTNDLRGKILRIHPTPEGGYTVPDGNLFAKGLAKTRPEIYVMGTRNPYSIAIDPVRKGIAWGDIGPDGKGLTEEHNFAIAPGNFGYPYFAGDNIQLSGAGTAAHPVNNGTKGLGLVDLPPAQAAINAYQQESAITGPIYRYDGNSKSTAKFPPHFDGLWFVLDFQTGTMDTISLNRAGTAKVSKGRVFPTMRFDRPIDAQMGPDGALYVINYAGWFGPATTTAIVRIEYTGTCRYVPPVALAPSSRPSLRALGASMDVAGSGPHTLAILDSRGRTLATFQGEGARRYDLSGLLGNRPGVYAARLSTPGGGAELRKFVIGPR